MTTDARPKPPEGGSGHELSSEIQRLRQEAEQRHDLIALAAHELRNPLHALALHLALVRGMADSKGADDISARVARAQVTLSRYAERVTVLMELLGSPELLYPVNPTQTDVVKRLEYLLESLEQEARSRGIAVRLVAKGPCAGLCDGIALEQVVDNLLLNAFKHSSAREVVVSVQQQAGQAVIGVADNGIGIAEEDQARIFEKFKVAMLGERGPGSGLGLWIVHRLLAAMGGTVRLVSRPGEGSVFEVSIPLQSPTPSP